MVEVVVEDVDNVGVVVVVVVQVVAVVAEVLVVVEVAVEFVAIVVVVVAFVFGDLSMKEEVSCEVYSIQDSPFPQSSYLGGIWSLC